jgi:hypothetical protein
MLHVPLHLVDCHNRRRNVDRSTNDASENGLPHVLYASLHVLDVRLRAAIAQKRYILLDDLVTLIDTAFGRVASESSSVQGL